ncbi:GNAT family N-acetyltransferase [Clostridium pasteurianum]|uniref:Acetyltransferase, ribosomal protein N-acetylase n=1 Tax=Clostridium pasteurianum BC1 TaxID=86416 RepID=R4K4F4_CLOPA|nr:GNAT family N-acetyltransferase [Clostridium pasteurianum]AGK96586.1 acetyltransferase, ribosomal protein N-acetylase [Clostridium pasteurianum BC1]
MSKLKIKNAQKIVIRKAIEEDTAEIVEYMLSIGGESDNLTFGEGELKMTIEAEENFIKDINSRDNAIMIVAILDNKIIGSAALRAGEKKRIRHVGEFGITVRKAYWGQGVGSTLLNYLIEWTKATGIIKKINLRVRDDNKNAIKLYEKYGFQQEGVITREFYIKGEFYDAIFMGLKID